MSAKELSVNDSDARKFNHNMIQLFEQLSVIYPNDHDIFTYRDKLTLLSKSNFKLPSEFFLKYAGKYVDQIMTCDDQFFLNSDDVISTDNPIYQELFNKIISLWKESSETVRSTIWKYMQVMLILAVKTHQRTDLVDQLNQYRKTPLVL